VTSVSRQSRSVNGRRTRARFISRRTIRNGRCSLRSSLGSTSVPGLAAKPIIDMLLVVEDSADEARYVPALERQGFVLRIRESDWFEHRLLKTPDIDGNLHVFSAGCGEIDRMIAFRNWLRANDDDRLLYLRTKQELAARTWKHVQNYADAKSDVVAEIMARALAASGV
jgi:GrpB-like predicted nucleotidyltransferase (UPF0157 family)